MDPALKATALITTAGTFWFPKCIVPGSTAFVEFCGTFGSGTVKIVYKDLAGATVAFKELDGTEKTFSAPNFVGIDIPKSRQIGLTVTVGGGTSIRSALHQKSRL